MSLCPYLSSVSPSATFFFIAVFWVNLSSICLVSCGLQQPGNQMNLSTHYIFLADRPGHCYWNSFPPSTQSSPSVIVKLGYLDLSGVVQNKSVVGFWNLASSRYRICVEEDHRIQLNIGTTLLFTMYFTVLLTLCWCSWNMNHSNLSVVLWVLTRMYSGCSSSRIHSEVLEGFGLSCCQNLKSVRAQLHFFWLC